GIERAMAKAKNYDRVTVLNRSYATNQNRSVSNNAAESTSQADHQNWNGPASSNMRDRLQ
ncbi:MAG: hypothetical protein AAGG44_21170, partial [Planctomycetota bacterium]